jgi:hypothetical protein
MQKVNGWYKMILFREYHAGNKNLFGSIQFIVASGIGVHL